MTQPLAGKTAFVTGGSRGIGRATALKLASAGCDVAIAYHNSHDEADQVCASVRALGRRAKAIQADVSEPESLEENLEREREPIEVPARYLAQGVETEDGVRRSADGQRLAAGEGVGVRHDGGGALRRPMSQCAARGWKCSVASGPQFGPVPGPCPLPYRPSALSGISANHRTKPLRHNDTALLQIYEDFFAGHELVLLEITPDVVEKATELRANLNLKAPDAIHLATAILTKATAFLTGDRTLARCTEVSVEIL